MLRNWLTVHFERGGVVPRAVPYWQQAGADAVRRYADPEALTALRKGLIVLGTLPESPARMQDELTRLLSLGEVLIAAKGVAAPEVGDVYDQARRLCHQLGASLQHFQVLQGLCRFYRAGPLVHRGRAGPGTHAPGGPPGRGGPGAGGPGDRASRQAQRTTREARCCPLRPPYAPEGSPKTRVAALGRQRRGTCPSGACTRSLLFSTR